MNKSLSDGIELVSEILNHSPNVSAERKLILATPFIHLSQAGSMLRGQEHIHLAAQNCHSAESGAFTGEISAEMLRSCEVEYVILGHSERRALFGESADFLKEKVNTTLAAGLKPIFCCGEPLDVREAGEHVKLVSRQIEESLFHLPESEVRKVVIAYEPVWAIGTGKSASAEQAQEMHAEIRKLISEKYNPEVAENLTILYGGSVKPANASELFNMEDVDGGLIGGASLKSDDFLSIFEAL